MTLFTRNQDTIWNGLFVIGALLATFVFSVGAVITHVA